jgi:pyruvate/2-oxoglutarate dehydrogenase complex dihydrolipoamide dehydrogenase (E3) component
MTRPPFDAVGPADQRLLAAVHPADWKQPTPAKRYNLVVLGAGTAGLVAAAGAAGLGARVALVERAFMGGDCLNFGCVPSKGLIRSARAAADAREAQRFGVRVEGVRPDLLAALTRMRELRADIAPHDSAARFTELGVDVFLGAGRFTGRRTLEVDGQALRFAKALIATGARAAVPPIPGLDTVPFHTNESIFSLEVAPARMVVVGGGPIGVELAQAFQRLGTQVFLVERAGRLLSRDDEEASAIVTAALAHDGVSVLTDATDLRFELHEGTTRFATTIEGEVHAHAVDAVLIATGRAPNVTGLGLEEAGVAFDSRSGVAVDARLRTTNRHIYAAGDVASREQFTHVADHQSRVVLRNALFPFLPAAKARLVVPRCTYCDPEVASVGLTTVAAEEQGVATEEIRIELAGIDRALLDGDTQGYLRVLLKPGTDTILGATLVARHAGEMVSPITTAMVHGLGLRKLASVIHAYPTTASIIARAADAANKQRLTPGKAKVLRWLMARLR